MQCIIYVFNDSYFTYLHNYHHHVRELRALHKNATIHYRCWILPLQPIKKCHLNETWRKRFYFLNTNRIETNSIEKFDYNCLEGKSGTKEVISIAVVLMV